MEKHIVFLSKKQELSLSIEKIEKIINIQKTIPIPETASFVLGIIEYNKGVLPIIDLNDRLYGTPTELNEDLKIIIVQWQKEYIGLLVESIKGISDFKTSQFEIMNNDITFDKNYIMNFIKTSESIVIQLDIDSLFEGNIMLDKLISAFETAETASLELEADQISDLDDDQ